MPSKGRKAEMTVRDVYEEAGYESYLPPKAKWREQDVFGVFDVLAFGHGRLEAAQVKSGRDAAGITDWFESCRVYEETIDDLRLSFIHLAEDCWRIARSDADGYVWVYDGRQEQYRDEVDVIDTLAW